VRSQRLADAAESLLSHGIRQRVGLENPGQERRFQRDRTEYQPDRHVVVGPVHHHDRVARAHAHCLRGHRGLNRELTGRVVDPTGTPLVNISVNLRDVNAAPGQPASVYGCPARFFAGAVEPQ